MSLFADHHENDDHKEGPCKMDREKFCKDVRPGEGRIVKCLHENKDKVSAECKAKWAERKEKMQEMKDACAADREKLCKDVKPGKGGIIKCLKDNEAALTEECKSSIPHFKKMKK